jgi:hypothetical protein
MEPDGFIVVIFALLVVFLVWAVMFDRKRRSAASRTCRLTRFTTTTRF